MNTSEAIRAIQQIEQEYAEDLNQFKSDKSKYDTKIKKDVLDQVKREDVYILRKRNKLLQTSCATYVTAIYQILLRLKL